MLSNSVGKLEPVSKSVSPEKAVMPAKAGIHKAPEKLDSRLRGNDKKEPDDGETGFRDRV
jgi:hypothetical protein